MWPHSIGVSPIGVVSVDVIHAITHWRPDLFVTPIEWLAFAAPAGFFFATAGWYKLFDAKRRASMLETIMEDGLPCPRFVASWTSAWELVAGLALFAGWRIAAFPLLVICLVACVVDTPDCMPSRARCRGRLDFWHFWVNNSDAWLVGIFVYLLWGML